MQKHLHALWNLRKYFFYYYLITAYGSTTGALRTY